MSMSKVSKRWLKQHQRHLKHLIEAEERFTKKVSDDHELLSNRLIMMTMYWLGGEEMLSNTKIRKNPTTIVSAIDDEMVKMFIRMTEKIGAEATEEKMKHLISCLDDGLETSKYKQKYYRYAHNMNMEKSKKYHAKLNENSVEQLEKMRQGIADGAIIDLCIDNWVKDKEDDVSSGENAYLKYAEEIKISNKQRNDMIKMMEFKMAAT